MATTITNTTADVALKKPQPGQNVEIHSQAGAVFDLDFDPSRTLYERVGDTLVFTFDDGGKITLTDFFKVEGRKLPTFLLEGERASAEDLFSNMDLSTAAGPGQGVKGSGSGEYTDDPGALIGGIDRLGSLGTDHWARGTSTPELPLAQRLAAPADPPSISITPGPGPGPVDPWVPIYTIKAGNVHLIANEGYLPNGSLVPEGMQGGDLVGEANFIITSNDGLRSVIINGQEYHVVDGAIQGFPEDGLAGSGGIMSNPRLVNLGDGRYSLSFTLTISNTFTHDEQGRDTLITDEPFAISVVSESGVSSSEVHLVVEVIDDVPEARNDTMALVEEGQSDSINVLENDVWGADAPADKVVVGAVIDDGKGGQITLTIGQRVNVEGFGTVTMLADGTLEFDAAVIDGKEHIPDRTVTYSIQDADGDISTASVVLSRDNKGNPVIVPKEPGADGLNLTVEEHGLVANDGSKTDSTGFTIESEAGAASVEFDVPGAGKMTLTVPGQGSVEIKDGNVVYGTFTASVDKDGNVTYEFTLNKELDNSAQGVDVPAFLASLGDDDGTMNITVTVTDTLGQKSDPADIKVTIVDDGPSAVNDTMNLVEEGQSDSINVLENDSWGADDTGAHEVVSATIDDGRGGQITLTIGQSVNVEGFGTVTMLADGTLTFEATTIDGNDTIPNRTVTYTIKDADGDTSSATVELSRDNKGNPVIVPNEPGADGLNLTVEEHGLVANDGSKTDSTGFTIESEAGAASVEFDVPGAGKLTLTVPGQGSVEVKDGNVVYGTFMASVDADGNVTYEFTLNKELDNSAQGVDVPAFLASLGDDDGTMNITVTVTDTVGQKSDPANVKVTIVDDGPSAVNDTMALVKEGQSDSINVLANDSWGADDTGPHEVVSATIDDGKGGQIPLTIGQSVNVEGFGKVTLQADGTLTFEATTIDGNDTIPNRTVTYTIQDADGDTSSATVELSRDNKGNPVIVPNEPGADGLNLTVEEHGLVANDGSKTDSTGFTIESEAGAASVEFDIPGAGKMTLTVPGQNSVEIVHDGITYGTFTAAVDADGNVTYEFTLNKELDNSAQGVDVPAFLASLTGEDGTMNITVTVTDTVGQKSDPANVKVTIVDDGPSAVNDTMGLVEEGGSDSINVLTNDSWGADDTGPHEVISATIDDGKGGQITLAIGQSVNIEGFGTVTMLADGTLTFEATTIDGNDAIPNRTVTYTIQDADGDTSSATVELSRDNKGNPVIVPNEPGADGLNLTVEEHGLVTGDDTKTDSTGFTVEAEAGVESVEFDIPGAGKLTLGLGETKSIPLVHDGVTYGTFTATVDADGNVTYEFTLNKELDNSAQGSDVPPFLASLGDDDGTMSITVTVTDTVGQKSEPANVKVTIVDDGPSAVNDTMALVKEGQSESINVLANDSWGADDTGPHEVVSATIDDGKGGQITLKIGEPTMIEGFGKVTLQADGTLTFEATTIDGKENIPNRTVTYTIEDADGDTSSATVELSRDNKGNPVIVPNEPGADGLNLTVEEHGLVANDGSKTDSTGFTIESEAGAASVEFDVPGAGKMTLTVPGQNSVEIVHDGVTYGTFTASVDKDGNVTYEFTLNKELDNSAQGFDVPAFLASLGDDDGTMNITVTVTDTVGQKSDRANVKVTIVDDGPSAVNDTMTLVEEGQSESINVLTNDSWGADDTGPHEVVSATIDDGKGGQITLAIGQSVNIEGFGTVTMLADGTLTFEATTIDGNDAIPNRTVTYTIQDADGDTSSATVELSRDNKGNPVIVPNEPGADGLNLTVEEHGLVANDSSKTDSTGFTIESEAGAASVEFDVPGAGKLTLTVPGQSSVEIKDGNVVYGTFTASVDKDGNVTYEFTLNKELDNSAQGADIPPFLASLGDDDGTMNITVTVTDTVGQKSDPANVKVTIVDDGPDAQNDTMAKVAEGDSDTINVLTNDSWGADDTGPHEVVSATIDDGKGGQIILTIGQSVNVEGFGSVTMLADGTLTFEATTIEGNDAIPNRTVTYTIQDADGDTSSATVELSRDNKGNPVIVPKEPGADGLNLTVEEHGLVANDGSKTDSTGFTIQSEAGAASVEFDVPGAGKMTLTVPGQSSVEIKDGNVVYGTFTASVDKDGNVTYEFTLNKELDNSAQGVDVPAFLASLGDDDGTMNITVTVTDTVGQKSDPANVKVTIVDDGPSAVNDTMNLVEEGQSESINVLANDSWGADDTGPHEVVSATIDDGKGGKITLKIGEPTMVEGFGKVTLQADGTLTFEATTIDGKDAIPNRTVTYTIRDADGDTSSATVELSRDNKGNPVIVPKEPGADGLNLTVEEHGLVANDGSKTDSTGFTIESEAGAASVEFDVPGAGKVTLTVPGQSSVEIKDGNVVYGTFTASVDKDGNVTYEFTLNKELDNSAQGSDIPPFLASLGDDDGTMNITVTVTDTVGQKSDPAYVKVTIVDDGPSAVNDTMGLVEEGGSDTINVLANDSWGADDTGPHEVVSATIDDGKGGQITLAIGQSVLVEGFGTVTMLADGTLTFEATTIEGNDAISNRTVTYTIQDADGDTSSATVELSRDNKGNPVIVPNKPGADGLNLTVEEHGLVANDGSKTDSTGFTIESEAGAASVEFDVPGAGKMVLAVPGQNSVDIVHDGVTYGTFTATVDKDGNVTYEFTLNKELDNSAQGVDVPAFLASLGDDDGTMNITVTVTDTVGQKSEPANVKVTIVDDGPDAQNDTMAKVAEGDSDTINVLTNDSWGADDTGPHEVVSATIDDGKGGQITLTIGQSVNVEGFGTVTMLANGTLTFEATTIDGKENIPNRTVTYTIKDADGDTSSATVELSRDNKGNPVIVPNEPGTGGLNLTVEEHGLVANDGSKTDSTGFTIESEAGAASVEFDVPGAGKMTLTVPGQSSVEIKDGNVVYGTFTASVDKDGNVTYEFTLNKELDNSAQGVDVPAFLASLTGDDGTMNITVTVTDTVGQKSDPANVKVTIVDDGPSAVNDTMGLVEEGGSDSINVLANDSWGADDTGAHEVVSATIDDGKGGQITLTIGQSVQVEGFGTVTMLADGTLTFEATTIDGKENIPNRTVTYTIRDADGDTSSATVELSRDNKGNPVIVPNEPGADGLNLTVEEHGLVANDGSKTDSTGFTIESEAGAASVEFDVPGAGKLMLTVPGQGSVEVKDGNVVYGTFTASVDKDGNVTYEFTLNKELDNSAQGSDVPPFLASLTGEDGTMNITVTVTDTVGQKSDPANVKVTIVDDGPSAVNDTMGLVEEGGSDTINVLTNDSWGADDTGPHEVVSATIDDGKGGQITLTIGQSVQVEGFGTVTMLADGTLTFEATTIDGKENIPNRTVTYTIRDADGDTSSATVELSRDNKGNPVIVPNEPGADGLNLTVEEHGLVANDGSKTDSTGFTIESEAGAASVEFDVPGAGKLTLTVPGQNSVEIKDGNVVYGTFTASVDKDGNVTYEFTLNKELDNSAQGSDVPPFLASLGDDDGTMNITVTVTDTVGQKSEPANVKVTIVDDGPSAVNDTMGLVEEGGSDTINVLTNDSWGADDTGPHEVVSATIDDGKGGQITLKIGEPTMIEGFGKVTLQANGTLTFEATTIDGKENIPNRTVTYTIKDADGDTSSATVELSRDNKGNPVIVPNEPGKGGLDLTVEEHGLVANDGSKTDSTGFTIQSEAGAANVEFDIPGAGKMTLTVPGQSSVEIKDGNVVYGTFTASVDKDGNVTYEFTLNKELDNSARGSDVPPFLASLTGEDGTMNITVTVTDTVGQKSEPANVKVTIVDDEPTSTLTFEDTYGPDDGIVASGTTSYGKFDVAKGADHGPGESFTVNGVAITSDNTKIEIPDYGTLVVNRDGSYSFTSLPYVDRDPIDIEFRYVDSDGDETSQTLTVGIEDPNSPPDAVDDAGVIRQGDTSIQGNLLTNDSDPDGDALTVVGAGKEGSHEAPVGKEGVTIEGQYGSVTIMPDGSYVYTPDPNNEAVKNLDGESLKDSFTYQVSDGNGGYDTAELEITIVDSTFRVGQNTDDVISGGQGNDIIVGDEGGVVYTPGLNYNVAIIMDTSGSMGEDAIAQAQAALKNLADQLAAHGEDCIVNVALIDFDRNAVVEWSGRLTADTLSELYAGIDRLESGGGTNYEAGFNAANKWFQKVNGCEDGCENQVYFITDGKPTYYYSDSVDISGTQTITTGSKEDLVPGAKATWNASSGGTAWLTTLTYNADGTISSSNRNMLFRFDEDGVIQFRTYSGGSWSGWTGMSKPTWTQTRTVHIEIPEDYVFGDEVYYDANGNRLPNENGAVYRISDKFSSTGEAGDEKSTIYMQKYENGKWVDKQDIHKGSGNSSDGTENSQSKAAYDRLLESLGGNLKVNVIGIGEGTNKDLLDPYDNTGGAQIIVDASELDAALKEASTNIKEVGADTVYSGEGNDVLFGDAMNADHLLPDNTTGPNAWAEGLRKGDSIAILRAYLAAGMANVDGMNYTTGPGGTVTNDDIRRYIQAHIFELAPAGDTRGGDDKLYGGEGNDILFGQGGNDLLDGGDGNDILVGGWGDDVLTGGDGADVFLFYRGDGNDTITDFNKTEGDIIVRVDKGPGEFGSVDVRGEDVDGAEYTVADVLQGHSVRVTDQNNAYMLVGAGVDGSKQTVDGIDFDNVLVGGNRDDVIIGGRGNNLLVGGAGDDYIVGGDGNDIIYGGSGNNILIGGGGSDIFAWSEADIDGGYNTIMDFSFKEGDKLNFNDLLDQGQGFNDLLDLVTITSINDGKLVLNVHNDGKSMAVEVRFQNGELSEFIDNYTEQHGNTNNMDEALLHQMLQNIFS